MVVVNIETWIICADVRAVFGMSKISECITMFMKFPVVDMLAKLSPDDVETTKMVMPPSFLTVDTMR